MAGVDDDDEDWTPTPAPQPTGPPPAPTPPAVETSSAVHNLCTWGFFKGRDIAHYDSHSTGVPEGITSKNEMLAHCRDSCEVEANCHGFAWFGPGKKCEFKTNLPSNYNEIMYAF